MLKALAQQAKVLSGKYPIVCTNPPYLNKMEGALKKTVTRDYKDYSGDLFSVFTYRNLMFCEQDGYCGYMTPFVWMFIKTYEKLREFIIRNKSITTLVQMEYSAFEEATVPICSFVLKNGRTDDKGLYFKLSEFKGGMEVQKQKVLEALENKDCGYFYEADQSNFSKIPGSPVAYWLSERVIDSYQEPLVGDVGYIKKGMFTGANDLFFRLWFEASFKSIDFGIRNKCDVSNRHYVPMNSGGAYRRWYGNRLNIIKFDDIHYNMITANNGHRNPRFYFQKAAAWTKVTSGSFSLRISEIGFINNDASMAIYEKGNSLELLAGLLNSKVAQYFLNLVNESLNYTAGNVASIPFLVKKEGGKIEQIVFKNISTSKNDWDSYETSWDFKRHPLV